MNASLHMEKDNQLHQYKLYEQRMRYEENEFYASLWRRWLAFTVDRMILFVACLACIWMLVVLGEQIEIMQHSDMYTAIDHAKDNVFIGIFGGALLFMLFVCPCLYYALFESSRLQATPGKLLLGLAVVDQHNKRVRFTRTLSRSISKEISSWLFGIGFLLARFTPNKQALHDMIAKTYVVDNQARHRINYLQYKCEQHIDLLDT
ncbi:RDD family protein [Paenibacillus sp. WLX2291]|uniref:RDD family protein n=1 Tax=Paenibacillus sp. WLX2291 TaxID=3296934 RepID=UPI0039843C84